MNKINNRIFVLVLILTLFSNFVFAQSKYIKGRWNLKAAYTRYETGVLSLNNNETTGQLLLEFNYGLFKFLEAGLYLGIGDFRVYGSTGNPQQLIGQSVFTPFYGINANFHILPFFIQAEDFRFDLYFTGKLGAQYFSTGDNFYYHGNILETGIGGGVSFYPWKHFGLYIEYSYGKYFYSEDKDLLRYGLSIKF